MTRLAQWLHDRRIDCKWEYRSPVDIGLGRDYTADHEPAHERAADELRAALLIDDLVDHMIDADMGTAGQ